MSNRLYQLAARWLSKGLLALTAYLGGKYGEGQADVIVTQILSVGIAIGGVIADHWIHRAEQASE